MAAQLQVLLQFVEHRCAGLDLDRFD